MWPRFISWVVFTPRLFFLGSSLCFRPGLSPRLSCLLSSFAMVSSAIVSFVLWPRFVSQAVCLLGCSAIVFSYGFPLFCGPGLSLRLFCLLGCSADVFFLCFPLFCGPGFFGICLKTMRPCSLGGLKASRP